MIVEQIWRLRRCGKNDDSCLKYCAEMDRIMLNKID